MRTAAQCHAGLDEQEMPLKHTRPGLVLTAALALLVMAIPLHIASAQGWHIRIPTASRPLPLGTRYSGHVCRASDGHWQPGQWVWGPFGFFRVPDCWTGPPIPDFLGTPVWWGFYDSDLRHGRFHRNRETLHPADMKIQSPLIDAWQNPARHLADDFSHKSISPQHKSRPITALLSEPGGVADSAHARCRV